jgi:DnaK suppressor protein
MLKEKDIKRLSRALRHFPRKDAPNRKNHYSASDLEQFKRRIISMQEDILEDIRLQKSSSSYVNDTAMHQYLLNRQSEFLRHLSHALRRIEQGDYGQCVMCGELIDKDRLMAVPHTQQCIACKSGRAA